MPDFPARAEWERRVARALARLQGDQLDRLVAALGDPPNPANVPLELWEQIGRENAEVLRPAFEEIAQVAAGGLLAALRGRASSGSGGAIPPESTVMIPTGGRGPRIEFRWGVVNQRAADWARRYTFDLVRGINRTSQGRLQQATAAFFEQQLTMGDLREQLAPTFGDSRAKAIAETEVTRAAVQGERGLVAEIERRGLEMVAIWNTSNDEIVCPVCIPRNQKRQGDGWRDDPPAHVRCRCWLNHMPAFMLQPAASVRL